MSGRASSLLVTVLGVVLVSACSSGSGNAACLKTADCASGSMCVFKIGSCSASGECTPTMPATCGAEERICGCGQTVITGCGYAQGYASGPSTGATACP